MSDERDNYAEPNVRLCSTSAAANAHNDPSDVVGLLRVARRQAAAAAAA